MTWTSTSPSPSIIPSSSSSSLPIPNLVPVRRSSSTPIPTMNGLLDPDIKLTRAQWRQLWKNAEIGKIHVSDEQFVEDINVQFLYKPHTLTAFAVIVIIIIYAAFTNDSDAGNTVSNTRLGISICAIFILILGLLVFPSGPFIRPHPVFWRLSFGIGVLYEMFLIILLFQTKHDARQSLTFLYPYLGHPLEEREYAADCTLTWTAFRENLFDMYFVGHFIGWFCKSLLLRNRLMCWTISVQWELIEMAFTHMLPNFAECWWDSWLLDVLISNGLGIICGHKVAQYLEMKQYTWNNVHTIPTLTGKLQRVAMQFTPESWTKVRWESTKSIKRFLSIQLLMLAFHVEELNAFFLKHILWIPPPCPLNHFRLAIWMFVGTPCIRQLYTYIVDPAVVRIGNHTLLGMVILSTELLNIVKFGQGEFPNPIPTNIKIGVGIYFTLYALFCLLMMLSIHTREGPAGPSWEDAPADAPEADVKHVIGNGNGNGNGNGTSNHPITKKQQ